MTRRRTDRKEAEKKTIRYVDKWGFTSYPAIAAYVGCDERTIKSICEGNKALQLARLKAKPCSAQAESLDEILQDHKFEQTKEYLDGRDKPDATFYHFDGRPYEDNSAIDELIEEEELDSKANSLSSTDVDCLLEKLKTQAKKQGGIVLTLLEEQLGQMTPEDLKRFLAICKPQLERNISLLSPPKKQICFKKV